MSFNKSLEENFDKNRKPSGVLDKTNFTMSVLEGLVSDEIMMQILKTTEKTFKVCGPQVAEKEILALAKGLGVLDGNKQKLIKAKVVKYSEAA